MWSVGREKKHVAFTNDDIFEFSFVNNFQHHSAFVLEEPFGRFVDVIISAGVGSSYYLLIIRACIVSWK
jgi:hypothetical protein